VALGKPSFQVNRYSSSFDASKGNDGDPITCVRSSTRTTNPWWAVDLGTAKSVYKVNFTNTQSTGK